MSSIESNINKLAESVLVEPEPTVIIKTPEPRDTTIIKKPVFNKMPPTFVKKVVDTALGIVADSKGDFFRRNIIPCERPTLFIDMNRTANKMIIDMRKDDDETSFAFMQQKQLIIEQIMGSLSAISDELWNRLTQTSIVETKTSETKNGKEIVTIVRRTELPALDPFGWQLANEGMIYSLDGKFICYIEQMPNRAAVYKPMPFFKPKTSDDVGWQMVSNIKSNTTDDEGAKPLRKTKTCDWWRNGKCRKSDDECDYAHEELDNEVKKPCINFAKNGECTYGDKCRYAHAVAAASIAGTYAAKAAAAELPKSKPVTGITGKKANAGAGKA